MTKIIAVHGGSDWYDASAEYVVLPDKMDIAEEQKKWDKWYHKEYLPARSRGEVPKHYTLCAWLLKSGARYTTADELQIVDDI